MQLEIRQASVVGVEGPPQPQAAGTHVRSLFMPQLAAFPGLVSTLQLVGVDGLVKQISATVLFMMSTLSNRR
jgi:hypothetical protein